MWTVSYTHLDVYKRQSFDCLQLHFVGESPFTGQDILTLEIAIHHEQNLSLIHISDLYRNERPDGVFFFCKQKEKTPMKNNITRTIRSEEITIDVRICAALAVNRDGEVYLAGIVLLKAGQDAGSLVQRDDGQLHIRGNGCEVCLLYTSRCV